MAKRKRRGRRSLDRWTEEDARRVLAECARSGLSTQAFARKRGLVPERLYRWQRKLGEVSTPPTISLVPARVVADAEAAVSVVVRMPEDVLLEIGDASPAWVATLIRELVKRR